MTATVSLVLASASPARLATLRGVGIEPTVRVSLVDENAVVTAAQATNPDLEAADVALLLAQAKAQDVATRVRRDQAAFDLILGCDSVLEFDGHIYGKPAHAAAAVERWRAMRGRTGVLHTGHWLIDERDPSSGGTRGAVGATASTTVHFAALSDDEIEAYVATDEPLHVAGAFTVDGLGGAFVTGIEGDYHNVVGLSLPLLRDLLVDLDVGWFSLVGPR